MQMHRTPADIIDNLNLQTFGNVQGTCKWSSRQFSQYIQIWYNSNKMVNNHRPSMIRKMKKKIDYGAMTRLDWNCMQMMQIIIVNESRKSAIPTVPVKNSNRNKMQRNIIRDKLQETERCSMHYLSKT